MPEFDGVPIIFRDHSEKALQARNVLVKVRRKLPEDWAHVFAKRLYAVKKIRDRFMVHVELFHLCNEPAAFDCENEAVRSYVVPASDHIFVRQAIKRGVDFD